MAITACAAKFVTRSICFSENGRTSCAVDVIAPTGFIPEHWAQTIVRASKPRRSVNRPLQLGCRPRYGGLRMSTPDASRWLPRAVETIWIIRKVSSSYGGEPTPIVKPPSERCHYRQEQVTEPGIADPYSVLQH